MTTINITCDSCGRVHKVARTHEIPSNVTSLSCNWCPCCEDTADGYYEERYNESDGDVAIDPLPDNPHQLIMPFIIEESLKEKA